MTEDKTTDTDGRSAEDACKNPPEAVSEEWTLIPGEDYAMEPAGFRCYDCGEFV